MRVHSVIYPRLWMLIQCRYDLNVLSDSLELDFVLETVERLAENHGIELRTETLIHSDQGCHYTSTSFIQLVKEYNLRQSMSRKADCWDNALQESFLAI